MKKPLFVDLFYAVVVGSAIQQIIPEGATFVIIYKLMLVLIVLEDWYMYFTSVIKVDPELNKYNFKSLTTEYLILVTWYFAFTSYPKNTLLFLVFISLYFLLRFVAGLSHYAKETPKKKWKIIREFTFLIPAIFPLIIIVLYKQNIMSIFVPIYFMSAWLMYVILWWNYGKKKT